MLLEQWFHFYATISPVVSHRIYISFHLKNKLSAKICAVNKGLENEKSIKR